MFDDQKLRRLAPAFLGVLGLVLFLPFLGSFGFWDPYEVRIADSARALSHTAWTWGPQLGRPALPVWMVAAAFKAFGVKELWGRLPMALSSIALLLATYWTGARLVGRRAALFGAFALATTPVIVLGGCSLVSDAPALLGAVLAVGGLARAAWPERDDSMAMRTVAFAAGALGLVIGQFTSGLLVGVLAPLLAVTIAHALAGGALGVTIGFALATAVVASRALFDMHQPGFSPEMGGMVHPLQHQTTWIQHVKQLGFALFPWVAVAPVAMVQLFSDAGAPDAPTEARQSRFFGSMVIASWFVCTWMAGTIQAAAVQDLHIPAGVPLMLLVGVFMDELFDDTRPLPYAGLAVALGVAILGHDFFLAPEQYVGVHMLDPIRWPGPLTHVPYVILAFAAFFAAVIGLGVGAPLASASASTENKLRARRLMFAAAAGSALLMALATQFWIVPQVSKHLSAREIYGKTRTLDPNAAIGQYRFNASGSSYYESGKPPVALGTLADVFGFLGRSERVFVMAGAEELPSLDQHARQNHLNYFVIDNSNSRYLVLSNRLGPTEKDLNPLKLFVSETPPQPTHKLEAMFEDKVQLLGYDLPDDVSRGQDFKARLYFKVLAPVGGPYKIFMHFDGPGTRFQGDHAPLDGRFPTTNWVPGYYITDEYNIVPDRARQVSGYYRVFVGFWVGDTRLKIVSGPQDGEQRLRLANLTVK